MRKQIFSPNAPRNQTLYGNHSPNGPPVGAAYMPPAHPARITNFSPICCAVGAGHARPSALPIPPNFPSSAPPEKNYFSIYSTYYT